MDCKSEEKGSRFLPMTINPHCSPYDASRNVMAYRTFEPKRGASVCIPFEVMIEARSSRSASLVLMGLTLVSPQSCITARNKLIASWKTIAIESRPRSFNPIRDVTAIEYDSSSSSLEPSELSRTFLISSSNVRAATACSSSVFRFSGISTAYPCQMKEKKSENPRTSKTALTRSRMFRINKKTPLRRASANNVVSVPTPDEEMYSRASRSNISESPPSIEARASEASSWNSRLLLLSRLPERMRHNPGGESDTFADSSSSPIVLPRPANFSHIPGGSSVMLFSRSVSSHRRRNRHTSRGKAPSRGAVYDNLRRREPRRRCFAR